MTVVTCKSTRYGEGCGHPVAHHDGSGTCCCCNWQQNDPSHVDNCDRCRPILAAYVARQTADHASRPCGCSTPAGTFQDGTDAGVIHTCSPADDASDRTPGGAR